MTNPPEDPRSTLARLLRRSQAHAGLEGALEGFPAELAGRPVEGHPHTAWQLVEHMRLVVEDMLSYCRDADYEEKEFPAGYWPPAPEPPTAKAWSASVEGLLAAVEAMAALIEDPAVDLYAQVPAAQREGHHVYRAALIVLDHDGYHAGQLIALRRALGAWPAA